MTVDNRLTIDEAATILGVHRRTLYRHCKAIQIAPERDGVNAYLSPEQLEKLKNPPAQTKALSNFPRLGTPQTNAIQLVQALAALMPQPQRDIFAPQRALQEAADKGWLLSTAQLSELLGLAPRTVRRGEPRLGFRFERVGRGWRVVQRPE